MKIHLKKLFIDELERHREGGKFYLLPGLILLFVIYFKDKTSQVLDLIFVTPLLSSLKASTIFLDIVTLVLGALIIARFIRKGIKQVKYSIVFEAYVILITLVYVLFRFFDTSVFQFVHFKIKYLKFLCLSDLLLCFGIGLIAYYVVYIIKYINKENNWTKRENGFFTDTPIVLDESLDHLGRISFIDDIKERILATNSPKHSFAVGIVGPWGTGKTTFLNTLYNNLQQNNEVIQIRFNPWVSKNVDNITAIFFSDLASRIAKFDNSLKKEIIQYSRELLQAFDNNILSVITSIFDFTSSEENLHEQYASINRAIQRLNKKIFIYIDDVDRLDKKEIIEVLRIIRNTANFSNIFFLVAFDKVYVTASIKEGLIENTDEYLEKIFQLEYYLPIPATKDIYKTNLLSELRKLVDQRHYPIIDAINVPTKGIFIHRPYTPFSDYILSFRDVNRYLNVFTLNFNRVKNNIYLPDYLSICIVRLKYPELYRLLYYNKFKFLTTGSDFSPFESQTGELFIRFSDMKESQLDTSILYKFLKENHKELAMAETDIDPAMKLINSIFNVKSNQGYFRGTASALKTHMSITDSSCFERYFDFSMSGRLDQAEFEIALQGSLQNLKSKIEQWNSTRVLSTDLQIKLENIETFVDTEQFEKSIESIVHYANLSIPQNPDYLNSFNIEIFYQKLGGKMEGNTILNNFYSSDRNLYTEFLKSLFKKQTASRWGFLQEFSSKLVKEYYDNFILTHAELQDLIKMSFFDAVNNSDKLTYNLLHFYNSGVRLFTTEHPEGKDIIVPTGKGLEMSEKLRELINKDIDPFLVWCISITGPDGRFRLDSWAEVVYGSEDIFDVLLEARKQEAGVSEYIKFRDKYRAANKPIDFNFETLDIRRNL